MSPDRAPERFLPWCHGALAYEYCRNAFGSGLDTRTPRLPRWVRQEEAGLIEPGAVLRIALIVVAGWVTAVWVCGAIYVAVSYVEAARFLPERSMPDLLRAVLRESWLVLWTQPLMIWFQFFGRRLGTGGGVVPVVLVHGYFQNRVDFLYLARRLRAAGSGPLYACNFFWPQSLERSSVNVAGFVAQVCAETGATAVDLVTHSTGGLFALDLIAEQPHVVRRAALVALPARGVPWRGPVLGKSGSQLRTGSLYQTERSTRSPERRWSRSTPRTTTSFIPYRRRASRGRPPPTSRSRAPDTSRFCLTAESATRYATSFSVDAASVGALSP